MSFPSVPKKYTTVRIIAFIIAYILSICHTKGGIKLNDIINAKEYDYIELQNAVYAIKGKYPSVELGSIGKSVMGKELYYLKIGKGSGIVLYAAAFHGLERITSVLMLRFAERLLSALESGSEIAGIKARRAMLGRSLVIIPRVNPDGCDIALKGIGGCGYYAAKIYNWCEGNFSVWNANARGVDINHNFDAGWSELQKAERNAGIYGPSPTRYGGPSPESEPETCALTNLCRKNNISHVLAFHSQGEEIYWRYGGHTPEKGKKMAEVFAASTGYALEAPIGLAAHGGFKDWFIEEFARPGFTIEVGKGKNPLDSKLLDEIYERIEEMLVLGIVL